ncbi:rhizobiocin RzcA [Asticcacaulis biprosthecium C19]|uniref:Rhizobiocin RzcA n=1 Tax=Asticcacaulis biprosthecium C19 TaxID=715226 RepID=F4QI32_9CAUL|nr:hypothetical protein [Asticcacaulis biprosthecium]EGF92899.1 rhizobiocin RzcA [Asticcacaulis biprosthecium C19]
MIPSKRRATLCWYLIGNNGLNALAGHDTLDDSAGNDTLSGGSGSDLFLFKSGSGAGMVTDLGAGDRIDIHTYTHGVANAGLVTQAGLDVVIALDGNWVTVSHAVRADVLAHLVW